MEVSFTASKNAEAPMEVTPSGITTAPTQLAPSLTSTADPTVVIL